MKMQIQDLTSKIQQYAQTVLAKKANTWMSKFAIGAGTQAMIGKIEPFVRTTGTIDENGSVDVDALHDIVVCGFRSAGHLDLLGGMIGFDTQDVEDFYAWIRR